MTIPFESFSEKVQKIRADLERDYVSADGKAEAVCIIMHKEVALDETPSDELAERLRERGLPVPENADESIDFTEEHAQLHHMLGLMAMEAARSGIHAADMMALMFVVGRRYGLREAAEASDAGEAAIEEFERLLSEAADAEER